ncbi:MAG: inosine/xanthosine triphosphatase [Thermoanaerobaculia bacterium]|nr:inosine/xanthosine triphosphatase [Thermoanaerobaculia bacterium]
MESSVSRERVVVASGNPVKIEASRLGFQRAFRDRRFRVEGLSVDVEVSDQPLTDEETRRGARLRVAAVAAAEPDAAFWVGIEGGVASLPEMAGVAEGSGEREERLVAFAWVAIRARSPAGLGESRTGTFELPPPVASLVRDGEELGVADDLVFGREGSKRSNGAVGLLTRDAIDRTELYTPAVVLALVPFLHPVFERDSGDD